MRAISVIFLDRIRDISSFLSPKICCLLWLSPSDLSVHLDPPGTAKPFPSPALSYSHQQKPQKEGVTHFFITAAPGMPRDSIPAVFTAGGKGAAQGAPDPGNCIFLWPITQIKPGLNQEQLDSFLTREGLVGHWGKLFCDGVGEILE